MVTGFQIRKVWVGMYKVMIVDDEVLVRVGLKTTIDWEAIGFTIVSEASNGEQGYENYQKHMPDVVITDIRMPKQDGLWLVEKIRNENKEAKILVLTCYDEFSYARKALKAGADDYILKSEVEDDELIKLMISIKEKLDLQNKSKIEEESTPNSEELLRSIFDDLIKNKFRMDEGMISNLNSVSFPINDAYYAFISIEACHTSDSQSDTAKVSNAIINILIDQLKQHNTAYIVGQQGCVSLLFIALSELKSDQLKRMLLSVGNSSMQYFNIAINAVYSTVFHKITEAELVFKEHTEKAQILFYQKDTNSIYAVDQISFQEPKVSELKKKYNSLLIEAIGYENRDKVQELLQEIGLYFERELVSPLIVKIFYSNLIGDLFGSYGVYLANREVFETHKTYHYQIEQSYFFRGIQLLVSDFSSKLISEIQKMRFINSKAMINQAINFIEYHYAEDISLDDVAKELSISKHYLCSAFKKETGENMSLFINKLRIEKAKQMLLERDAKIKEVYEKVGYANQQYFSKVFKKITGMTVIEYKEGMGRK
ncbi:MAG: response regulator [Herbinix sp.]|jgi:two-component system response regulator YesN|nr:response regulator [Herbinix sp.]